MKRSSILCLSLALVGFATLNAQETKPAPAKADPVTPAPAAPTAEAKTVNVEMKTSAGSITIELNKEKAPVTVANFLKYVEKKHYDGTVFHRVIDGFMIQGGGFAKNGSELVEKATDAPIRNEGGNGLKNEAGTIAMARTSNPDSATAQFFINVNDNSNLNQGPGSAGYAVFGKVTKGMEVVNQVKGAATSTRMLRSRLPNGSEAPGPHQNVPTTDIVVETVRVVP